jgi:hypothetical protein
MAERSQKKGRDVTGPYFAQPIETKRRRAHQNHQELGSNQSLDPTPHNILEVRSAKPDTSRVRSSELCLLASGFRMV